MTKWTNKTGRPYIDTRIWKEYNEELVVHGEYRRGVAAAYDPKEITVEGFIEKYHLSTRTANILTILQRIGSTTPRIPRIQSPRDLEQYGANQLLAIKGLGIETLQNHDRAFEQEGWHIQGIERYRKKDDR